jgi:hypothetical protein
MVQYSDCPRHQTYMCSEQLAWPREARNEQSTGGKVRTIQGQGERITEGAAGDLALAQHPVVAAGIRQADRWSEL